MLAPLRAEAERYNEKSAQMKEELQEIKEEQRRNLSQVRKVYEYTHRLHTMPCRMHIFFLTPYTHPCVEDGYERRGGGVLGAGGRVANANARARVVFCWG